MNAGKSFFDTNVLLYMHSAAAPQKQRRAQQLFKQCLTDDRIVLSTQVVQEFHVAGIRKLALPPQTIQLLTLALLELPLVQIGPDHIRTAVRNEAAYRVSFWDALILAAAESADAAVVYSEDLNHGQHYGSVQVQNPFRELPDA